MKLKCSWIPRKVALTYFMGVATLTTCMSVDHMHARCSHKPHVGNGFPGTTVTYSCEPPCVCWNPNPGPLEEEHVLLTAEPTIFFLFLEKWCHFFSAWNISQNKYRAKHNFMIVVTLFKCSNDNSRVTNMSWCWVKEKIV